MRVRVNLIKVKNYLIVLKKKFPVILTREPGGSIGAERIRDLILKDYFHKDKREKFHKYTDTLLYLVVKEMNIFKIKFWMLKKKGY